MTIALPLFPLPAKAEPAPIVFGGWQTPPTGGVEQWLGFMGSRMSMAITTPRLKPEPDGRLWTAALLDAWFTGTPVACRFPQPGLPIGAPGQPVVDGAGQGGMTLNLRGFTPGYAIRQRQFFSIVHAGRRYLHFASARAVSGADGKVALPIAPMLRVQLVDADVCEFAAPMIEGKLAGDAKGWAMIPAKIDGLQFTIAEVA